MFDWLTKPRLMMSVLDYVIMWSELLVFGVMVVFVWAFFSVRADRRRQARSIAKHGVNCTCFTCLGIRP